MKWAIISVHIQDSPQAVSLAAGLLKANLSNYSIPKKDFSVELLDFTLDNTSSDIIKIITDKKIDVCGFSTYIWNQPLVLETAKIFKQKNPSLLLFAGGPEITARPEALFPYMDFLIKGEGEEIFAQAVLSLEKGKKIKDLKGVLTPESGPFTAAINAPDLNKIPSPYLTEVLRPAPYSGVLWELSRGCPYHCSYCFESRGQKTVRRFPSERLKKELLLFEKAQVSQIFVLDPTFNQDEKNALNILKLIKENAPYIHFLFEVRAEKVTKKLAAAFSQLNCSLQIGLQSCHPEVLKKVNRSIQGEKFKEKIKLLESFGVTYGLDLIYGLPGDNLQGFQESIDFALALRPNNLDIFQLAVLPGTPLYDRRKEFNLKALGKPPYLVLETPDFPAKDIKLAHQIAEACSLFYNEGAAVGWFFLILSQLDTSPSEFFSHYACEILRSGNLLKKQLNIIKDLLERKNSKKLTPLCVSLIKNHSAWSKALYAGPGMAINPEKDEQIKLGSSVSLYTSDYDPEDFDSLEILSLKEFVKTYNRMVVRVMIFNNQGEVSVLFLEEDTWELSKSLLKGLTFGEALKTHKGFTSFLKKASLLEIVGPKS